ncbi:MAG: hypothetical protein K6T61_09015 [Bryobacteraceae bacterium]|nr:hypothetical protein [Bryobacteraceae bacterium]
MRRVSELAAELSLHWGIVLGMRQFLASSPWADPEEEVRRLYLERESNFLNLVRATVFSNPVHPYAQMFRLADCRFGDLEQLVRSKGLEAALTDLRRAGVYLSHEEFKGSAPLVRSGRHIPCSTESFRNPLAPAGMMSVSSGSRSRGTRTPKSTAARLHAEAWRNIHQREWQVEDRVPAALYPILPSTIFLTAGLAQSRRGRPWQRWFTVVGSRAPFSLHALATQAMVALARIHGAWIPFPTFLQLNDFSPVARWIGERKREGRSCAIWGFASPCVRVAAAALELGLDISGTIFVTGGEALSEAKRAVLARAEAEAIATYYISEVGCIGVACRQMGPGNSVHVHEDEVAVISWPQQMPGRGAEVNALLFTTLLPFAPHVLINAEMGDAGVLETASCECLFTRLGFRRKISGIYSYSKLTGQGVTLVGKSIVRLLEEALPARFGGGPGDYQLVELEGSAQTELLLRVSPRTGIRSPEPVRDWFLREIRNCYGGSLAARSWRHSDGITVVLAEPLMTRGKILPLVLLNTGHRESHEAQDVSGR